MIKYGIDWLEENKTDGGYLDRQIVEAYLGINEKKNRGKGNSSVSDSYIEFDKKTDTYYLVIQVGPGRRWSKSIINVIVEGDIINERIEETIELPRIIDATVGDARLVIPTNIDTIKSFYDVNIKYRDSEQIEYKTYGQNNKKGVYAHNFEIIFNDEIYKKFEKEIENSRGVIFDKEKMLVEYGFCDYTYGGKWKRIDGIEPYKNEEGIWTSDVVNNPEKYLESHLDWYYSDERMVEYIEEKGLLPQDKIDAIRAANYEDIFSFEYKMKSAIKIIPIVLVIIVIAILVIKKIRKKIF